MRIQSTQTESGLWIAQKAKPGFSPPTVFEEILDLWEDEDEEA